MVQPATDDDSILIPSPLFLHDLLRSNAPISALEEAITAYPEILRSRDEVGRLPLHISCHQFHAGPINEKCDDDYFITRLNLLLVEYEKVTSQLFINDQEKSNFLCDYNSQTPLFDAVSRCDDFGASMCEALLRVFPRLALSVNEQMRTPLHCYKSGTSNSIDIVRVLTNCFPESAAMVDIYGRTPLHMLLATSAYPSLGEVLLLVEAYPGSSVLEDVNQKSPIVYAWESFIRNQSVNINDDVVTYDDKNDEHKNFINLIEMLWTAEGMLESYSEEQGTCLNIIKTLVKFSIYQAGDLFRFLSSALSEKERKYLLHASAASSRGWGALHKEGDIPILERVLDGIGDLSVVSSQLKDTDGNLPLHIAAKSVPYGTSWCLSQEEDNTHLSNIELLLQLDKDGANICGEKGRLPLHWAIASGKSLDNGVLSLSQAFNETLLVLDPMTRLKPFMMTALSSEERGHHNTGKEYSLDDIYQLLQANPCAITLDQDS